MKAEDIKANVKYTLVNKIHGTYFKGKLGKSKYIKDPYLTGKDGNGVRCQLPLSRLKDWELIDA